MSISWDSLYLPSANQDRVATTLKDSLQDLGYQLYDPFGLLTGKSYRKTVRLFVAPPAEDWVRVIGSPDPRLVTPLSALNPCLYLALDDDQAVIQTFANGGLRPTETILKTWLKDDCTQDQLQHALTADDLPEVAESSKQSIFHQLPDDIQALAEQVDENKAQKMFDRLSGDLMQKVGGTQATDAAHDLIDGHAPDWNSTGGRRIHALMRCLTTPDQWRDPTFTDLRDAFPLHRRRQRKPDARLYPGDEDTMNQVPDALDYVPVYAGRDD